MRDRIQVRKPVVVVREKNQKDAGDEEAWIKKEKSCIERGRTPLKIYHPGGMSSGGGSKPG